MVEKNVNREDLVVTTKLMFGTAGDKKFPNCSFLSRKRIIEGLKASLKRLNFTYVDVLYAHRFDQVTPLEE
jgi:aryl-alcohol dehydrogenase-like predicted oxidoreductase